MGASGSRGVAPDPKSPIAIFGGLPKGLEARLDNMSAVQRQRTLLQLNKVADSCFRECCVDFGMSKYLTSGETECLSSCVEKYVKLSASVGGSFADFLAQHDPQAAPRLARAAR